MCADMIDLKKAKTRIKELNEELKATREGYEEEIEVLVENNGYSIYMSNIFYGHAPLMSDISFLVLIISQCSS